MTTRQEAIAILILIGNAARRLIPQPLYLYPVLITLPIICCADSGAFNVTPRPSSGFGRLFNAKCFPPATSPGLSSLPAVPPRTGEDEETTVPCTQASPALIPALKDGESAEPGGRHHVCRLLSSPSTGSSHAADRGQGADIVGRTQNTVKYSMEDAAEEDVNEDGAQPARDSVYEQQGGHARTTLAILPAKALSTFVFLVAHNPASGYFATKTDDCEGPGRERQGGAYDLMEQDQSSFVVKRCLAFQGKENLCLVMETIGQVPYTHWVGVGARSQVLQGEQGVADLPGEQRRRRQMCSSLVGVLTPRLLAPVTRRAVRASGSASVGQGRALRWRGLACEREGEEGHRCTTSGGAQTIVEGGKVGTQKPEQRQAAASLSASWEDASVDDTPKDGGTQEEDEEEGGETHNPAFAIRWAHFTGDTLMWYEARIPGPDIEPFEEFATCFLMNYGFAPRDTGADDAIDTYEIAHIYNRFEDCILWGSFEDDTTWAHVREAYWRIFAFSVAAHYMIAVLKILVAM
ncbi:uncharacterized protein B0H18DRAFT_1120601 [Fomitopsis serialis]|uniref:uncharacterized protein n=1 Tax=Fomitopsis serialis TaxID=139415 RepID=UPI0020086178|nr:uncharacterized protein B0H18DRAFT_1120601 [Neoantrodia serialis]KAH9923078.1 hypothetical protein B0H18DRAFT_1120601 [Neoantrodia serialis]